MNPKMWQGWLFRFALLLPIPIFCALSAYELKTEPLSWYMSFVTTFALALFGIFFWQKYKDIESKVDFFGPISRKSWDKFWSVMSGWTAALLLVLPLAYFVWHYPAIRIISVSLSQGAVGLMFSVQMALRQEIEDKKLSLTQESAKA